MHEYTTRAVGEEEYYTTLAVGEEEVSTTLATGEEEPVTGATTWNLGEEDVPPDVEERPSTRMYGEEGELVPGAAASANPFGAF